MIGFMLETLKLKVNILKKAIALDKNAYLKLRGVQADPACFNATRFWVSAGVKVEIKDKSDPTPYWLISSRKAKALAACLN